MASGGNCFRVTLQRRVYRRGGDHVHAGRVHDVDRAPDDARLEGPGARHRPERSNLRTFEERVASNVHTRRNSVTHRGGKGKEAKGLCVVTGRREVIQTILAIRLMHGRVTLEGQPFSIRSADQGASLAEGGWISRPHSSPVDAMIWGLRPAIWRTLLDESERDRASGRAAP